MQASAAPLIAVCTPVYNGERFLAETMACVQAQTYPNVVHVVLDNASTDSTPEIIERFRGGPAPLLVGRNPETVPASENANRVVAMQPEETAYFCVLCADDLLMPHALERMAAIMERDPEVDVVAAAQPDPWWNEGWPEGDVFDGKTIAAAYLRGELPPSFGHALYRRKVYEARAPEFLDARINSDDVDVALAAMCEGKVGYVHEPSVITREHDGSISSHDLLESRLHHADHLVLLKRYADRVFAKDEAEAVARRLKRYYFRRMLRWRFIDHKPDRVRRHLARLEIGDAKPTALDYCDALIDWPLRKLGLRPHWSGFNY